MSEKQGLIVPAAKKRNGLLAKMPEKLQEIAKIIDERIGKSDVAEIIAHYDVGALIEDVHTRPEVYGKDGVEQLAAYNGRFSATALYGLRDFAKAFPGAEGREYIKDWSLKPMAIGGNLSLKHWLIVRQVVSVKEREKLLTRVLREGYTANQLMSAMKSEGVRTKNTRSGGRRPGVPTSPLAGFQRLGKLAQQIANFEEHRMGAIFDAVDDMSPDNVNEVLLDRLTETKAQVEETMKQLEGAQKRIDTNITRVEKVLSNKKDDKKDDEKTKPEVNGQATASTGKKKKKRPVAATTA